VQEIFWRVVVGGGERKGEGDKLGRI
jgi:hypothetical protein